MAKKRKKYVTIYRDTKTGRRVKKDTWKRSRAHGGKRYKRERIKPTRRARPMRPAAPPRQRNFRYILRKRTPKGQFRGTKWKEAKVEVSITSNEKLDAAGIATLRDMLATGEELPDGIRVDLVEWTTGRKTKSYSSESDAETGFSRFSEFFSEPLP